MPDYNLFVVAWMSLGSVKAVAVGLETNQKSVLATAALLRSRGVNLPAEPAYNIEAARAAGFVG